MRTAAEGPAIPQAPATPPEPFSLRRSGSGDYTAERHQWLNGLTVEDIRRDMEAKGLTQK